MSKYTVKRSIEDIKFDESHVEEIRQTVREKLVSEGSKTLDEDEIEKRVKNRLRDIAQDQTLHEQGDNRLHHDISYKLLEDETLET